MNRSYWLAIPCALGALTATSCNLVEESAQYIAPFAAEIVLLNIPSDSLAEYGVNAPSTVSLTVTMGKLTDPGAASTSPFSGEGVAGATVTVTTPEGAIFTLQPDDEPGIYTLTSQSEPDFKYMVGGTYQVDISYNNQSFWSKFEASDEVQLTQPTEIGQYHAPGAQLDLAWTPATDTAVVAVFDESGNTVYDNIPRDLNGLYTFLTQNDVSTASVPGDKFTAEHVYGVGVAGLERTAVDEQHFSTSLNWLVSNAVTGTAAVTAVTTYEVPDIPESAVP